MDVIGKLVCRCYKQQGPVTLDATRSQAAEVIARCAHTWGRDLHRATVDAAHLRDAGMLPPDVGHGCRDCDGNDVHFSMWAHNDALREHLHPLIARAPFGLWLGTALPAEINASMFSIRHVPTSTRGRPVLLWDISHGDQADVDAPVWSAAQLEITTKFVWSERDRLAHLLVTVGAPVVGLLDALSASSGDLKVLLDAVEDALT